MYVIIGGSGYLGSYFIKNLTRQNKKIIATYTSSIPKQLNFPNVEWIKLDISNLNEIEKFCDKIKDIIQDTVIIFLAAYHHPDKVKQFPHIAWHINITALSHFLNNMGNPFNFYYSSSDSVYGESINGKIFSEDDQCNPVNLYGKLKHQAEQLTLTKGYNVIRYPFLIGKSLIDKKHFYDIILDTIESGNTMEMFSDSYRNTLSFDQAAKLALALDKKIANQNIGIINICSDNPISKYEVGLKIAATNKFDNNLIISTISTNNTNFSSVKRASSTLMSNKKLKSLIKEIDIIYNV